MNARRLTFAALFVGLPFVVGCQTGNQGTLTSSTQRHGLFGGLLCGKKHHEEPKPAATCLPQQDYGQYTGSAMYMEGPSLMGGMGGSSCSSCSTGSVLPGSSLPCAPGSSGALTPTPAMPGAPTPAPSRTVPQAQPIEARPTKLSPSID